MTEGMERRERREREEREEREGTVGEDNCKGEARESGKRRRHERAGRGGVERGKLLIVTHTHLLSSLPFRSPRMASLEMLRLSAASKI